MLGFFDGYRYEKYFKEFQSLSNFHRVYRIRVTSNMRRDLDLSKLDLIKKFSIIHSFFKCVSIAFIMIKNDGD